MLRTKTPCFRGAGTWQKRSAPDYFIPPSWNPGHLRHMDYSWRTYPTWIWHSPWKWAIPKKLVFQPSIFRCELLVSGRVDNCHFATSIREARKKDWFIVSYLTSIYLNKSIGNKYSKNMPAPKKNFAIFILKLSSMVVLATRYHTKEKELGISRWLVA